MNPDERGGGEHLGGSEGGETIIRMYFVKKEAPIFSEARGECSLLSWCSIPSSGDCKSEEVPSNAE